ncbi:winged helix-turn-helix domain-containing protein [Piscinibacter sp. HJYY11]|uniref:ATP-binding protein n=1 Tax=Piscinibacter sp. HJYY11 TaxID=2801333 RepID=UPI00191CBAC1|nr:winged helix-turn-helix domain-containing protein [Piscinibacter sp. HJYY11]MBL0727544.1 helix-turn-helix transcriptional regulator [Piscinibacter sp. HJYY11]
MPSQADQPHRFDRIEVRPAQRQLLVDGRPAALGARAFDLLLALIEHRDRVVSKNELLDLVWPGLVVEENNLQVQVSTLRKLLGPKAIATVPGRGYRFTLEGEAAVPPTATPQAPTAPRTPVLPQRPQPIVGRDEDLVALLSLLDAHPLVTLVGPGGIGKTTLAHGAAQARATAWADGCTWVELAALTDGQLVAGTIAQALELQLSPGHDAIAALVAALKPMQLLLVLDNAEHLADAVARIAVAVMRDAPGVRLLVTSQSPLRVQGEQLLRLEALATPKVGCTLAEASRYGAVALFAERARAADRRFALSDENLPHVLEICRRLDGLPLALELAAARVPLLGVRGVAERLDDRFKLLSGGSRSAPTRQQTLQAALEWSLGLLPEAERQLFLKLGVFAGGFTLALASDVLASDGVDDWALIDALARLAEHSLLSVSGAEVPRYGLSETARAYALSSSSEAPPPRERHAQTMQRFFDSAPADWLRMPDALWLARYEPELDNLRAALAFAYSRRDDALAVVSLVGSAAPLWHHLSLYDEARRWHERSEALVTDNTPGPLAARWWRAAQWAWTATDPERARAAAAKAQALYRQLGDVHGLYAELTGLAGMWREPNPMADAALSEALALERPDWPARERAWGQRARADVARANGRMAESRIAREAELSLRTQAGDERGRLRALALLAELADAEKCFDEAIGRWQALIGELRSRRSAAALASALRGLAKALTGAGRMHEAENCLADAARLVPTR